jgi:hypothetical protein
LLILEKNRLQAKEYYLILIIEPKRAEEWNERPRVLKLEAGSLVKWIHERRRLNYVRSC